MKEYSVARSGFVEVHQRCPKRPYLELSVPNDVVAVKYIVLEISSRDQGWADPIDAGSYTWIDLCARRPPNRTDLRLFTPFENDRGVPEFHDHTVRWDETSVAGKWAWTSSLQAGDVIQLVPRAAYQAWINLIGSARITIGYEPFTGNAPTRQVSSLVPHRAYERPLRSLAKEIRLLHLHPGERNDPIICSMKYSALGSGEDFEALSYCWGDSTERSELTLIFLDEGGCSSSENFVTSRSAFTALRQLRHNDKPRVIWIDQLCINQADDEERSQQVHMMAEIYSTASTVNIWLGEGNSIIEAAIRVVRDIHNLNVRVCEGGQSCHCIGTKHTVVPATLMDSIEKRKAAKKFTSFRGMYEVYQADYHSFPAEVLASIGREHEGGHLSELMPFLFLNPWFQRTWVLQEALRARTAFVYCGSESITWNELLDVNTWLNDTSYRFQETFLPAHGMMLSIWTNLRPQRTTLDNVSTHGEEKSAKEIPTILDVFLDGLEMKATDSRDKLFALLSFGRETCVPDQLCPAIRPSYSKSPKRVFADFTRWWIRENKSLAILSSTHGQLGRTWVRVHCYDYLPQVMNPTWSIGSDGKAIWARTTLQSIFQFKACGSTMPNQVLLDDDLGNDAEVLKLEGFRLAEIDDIMYPALEDVQEHLNPSVREFLTVYDQIIDPCANYKAWADKPERARDEVRLPPEVERRLFNNMNIYDHLSTHWSFMRRPSFSAVRIAALFSTGKVEKCETREVPACLDPCFFTTSNGMFGLCPWATRKGDLIAILYGGDIPLLLRPAKAGANPRPNDSAAHYFELVGECYVSGVMHGEALAERDLAKPDVFTLV